MLVETKIIRNKLRELSEELPSWESAWRAIYEIENYLTELEEGPQPAKVPQVSEEERNALKNLQIKLNQE